MTVFSPAKKRSAPAGKPRGREDRKGKTPAFPAFKEGAVRSPTEGKRNKGRKEKILEKTRTRAPIVEGKKGGEGPSSI